jgi:CspA family cold shock protein
LIENKKRPEWPSLGGVSKRGLIFQHTQRTELDMQYGTVKKWDTTRGFGFIVSDDDEDLFVNANDLDITLKSRGLEEGDRVSFDIRSDLKGEKAINVRLAR